VLQRHEAILALLILFDVNMGALDSPEAGE
jgi:hypothetical protein